VLSHTEKENAMSSDNLSRRTILAGAASVPALALPAVAAISASLPDPIFAAIERMRTAEAVCDALDENDDAIDAPVYEYWKVRSALARTVPTTPDGLMALSSFLLEAQANLYGAGPYFDEADDAEAFAASLDTAVRRMMSLTRRA